MNHKRKHKRYHSTCSICKPNKKGWTDRRTVQEMQADESEDVKEFKVKGKRGKRQAR